MAWVGEHGDSVHLGTSDSTTSRGGSGLGWCQGGFFGGLGCHAANGPEFGRPRSPRYFSSSPYSAQSPRLPGSPHASPTCTAPLFRCRYSSRRHLLRLGLSRYRPSVRGLQRGMFEDSSSLFFRLLPEPPRVEQVRSDLPRGLRTARSRNRGAPYCYGVPLLGRRREERGESPIRAERPPWGTEECEGDSNPGGAGTRIAASSPRLARLRSLSQSEAHNLVTDASTLDMTAIELGRSE
jgi:hypothetical protein